MELVKWLCEFFFDNPWHWAGLVIVCFTIFPMWKWTGRTTIHND